MAEVASTGEEPAPSASGTSAEASVDEAPARSFLRAFLALFLFCMAALCATSVLLDPTGIFGIRLVPPSQQMVRDDKAVALAERPDQAEILIFGSSRVWAIRPKRVSELTGLSAFNFGIDNPIPRDFEATYRYARSLPGARVKRILIGLEVEVFDAQRAGHLDYSRLLRPYAPPGALKPYWMMMPEFLFGADVIDSDVRSIRTLFTSKFMPGDAVSMLPKLAFHRDGSVDWPKYDKARENGTFDLEKQLALGFSRYRPTYAAFHELDRKRIEEVRALLEGARRDGVEVDVFIPPHHPAASKALENIDARNQEARRLFAKLASEGLCHWFPRTRLADFNGTEAEYYDFQHMTNVNGDKLLANVYGPGPQATK